MVFISPTDGLALVTLITFGVTTFGSILTIHDDPVSMLRFGLMFCYHCKKQMDPNEIGRNPRVLDKNQTLIGFECKSCRKLNWFPILPKDIYRALTNKSSV